MAEYVWQDRKRTVFGLPLSFTVYKLTEEKLLIETGFLSKKEEEVRLYRIMDLTLNRPLGQRLFKVGTIHCCTADKSTPEFDIAKIKRPEEIKNMLSDMIEAQREKKRVSSREFMSDIDDCDFDNE
ncbi:MAG: PH domain-containing protein [Clostridia bacterium]|nr:PH domain-containing protein [Clostridia bacterium]MBR6754452.1 PH domain-containing protein [Clostridia bacterium]